MKRPNTGASTMIEFAGQTYLDTATLGREGRKAASRLVQANDDPLGTATDLVGALLPLIRSADTPHADLRHLMDLVSIVLQDGVAAHDRRIGIVA